MNLRHFCRGMLAVCRSGSFVRRINVVTQRRARLVLGWVTVSDAEANLVYATSHPGLLSLVIPPWLGAVSTGDGFGHRYAEETASCA